MIMVDVNIVQLMLPYDDHADVALSNLSSAHVQSLHMLAKCSPSISSSICRVQGNDLAQALSASFTVTG